MTRGISLREVTKALDADIDIVIGGLYLVAIVLFILGLRRLGSPATARSGNATASLGMLLAVVVTLFDRDIVDFEYIIAGIVVGAAIGAVLARTIKLTAMPQLVAIFNGFGGAASAVVAASELNRLVDESADIPLDVSITIMLGTLIGTVTFSGSIIAFGKLQEVIYGQALTFPLRKTLNVVLFAAIVALVAYLSVEPGIVVFAVLVAVSLVFGILLVMAIGGADMPVVISLLNSYSGVAASMAGFVLGNPMLIVAGALVGAAGLILTQIMTRAMNRSLVNVMFGAFGAVQPTGPALTGDRTVREVTAQDAAIMLAYARNAVFVPGYGLAVAQAQHQLRELGELLESRGVAVKYAIHPVAGRMPGHMNVLLAEAEVSYDKLYDLDQINDQFPDTDVVIVVGANDVVNPAARDDEGSPIYGMPILEVDKSRQIIVIKRSLSPGFAAIDNELFYKENTAMFFSDAKAALADTVAQVKETA